MSVKKVVIFAILLLLIVPRTAFGEEVEEHSSTGEFIQTQGVYEKPGATIQSDTAVTVVSGPTLTSKKFVKYLTGSWAKATSYTWSQSNSVSSTVSTTIGLSAAGISAGLGIANTVTTTYSVAITIPADNTRYSKLAFYSDYNKRYVKVSTFNHDGMLYKTEYTYHYAPRKDTYLAVAYQ